MGKFYLTVLAASVFATTTFAQSFTFKRPVSELTKQTEQAYTQEGLDALQKHGFNVIGKLRTSNKTAARQSAQVKRAIIKDTPSGKLYKDMYNTAHGYFKYWGDIFENTSDGNVMDIVVSDKALYIKNPISMSITDSWIKGDIVKSKTEAGPDTIVVQLPQLMASIYDDEAAEDVDYYAYSIDLNKDAEGYINPKVSAEQQIKFTWNGDTLRKLGTTVLGLTDSNKEWTGLGDDSIVVFAQKDVPATLPASATKTDYVLSYKNPEEEGVRDYKFVQVAKDGDDIYIGNLVDGQQMWAKGSVSGDKVVFKKQYLGIDRKQLYHKYYVPVGEIEGQDKWHLNEAEELDYAYDAGNGKISTDKDFVVNNGQYIITNASAFTASVLAPKAEKAVTPPAPIIKTIVPYDPSQKVSMSYIRFLLPVVDDESNYFDVKNLYYKVYVNNDENTPFTFKTTYYSDLTEDKSEFSATFHDLQNFPVTGISHTIYLNDPAFADVTSMGVKAIYKVGDEVKESAVTWSELPSGINSATKQNSLAKTVNYYDLSGRRITELKDGIYIKTVKYADGSMKTIKVVNK